LCAESAHIYVDECGAPEKFIGCKLIPIFTANGKLSPELLLANFKGIGDQHHSQIKAISLTQSTEYGTVYTISELIELVYGMHAQRSGAPLRK
jgi:threonine aldolase